MVRTKSAGIDSETRSLRERKREELQARIIAGARMLFREQGFSATTYDEIAARTGVPRRTLFLHFPTKEQLALSREYEDFRWFAAELVRRAAEGTVIQHWRDFLAAGFRKPGEELADSLEYKRVVVFSTPALLAAHRSLEFKYLAALTSALRQQLGWDPERPTPLLSLFSHNLVFGPGVVIEAHIRVGKYDIAVDAGLRILDQLIGELLSLPLFAPLRPLAT